MKQELKEYNGYTNYPTWHIMSHILDNQELYDYWRDETESIFYYTEKEEHLSLDECRIYNLASELKNQWFDIIWNRIEDHKNTPLSFIVEDLIKFSFDWIDWHDIATKMITDFVNDKEG